MVAAPGIAPGFSAYETKLVLDPLRGAIRRNCTGHHLLTMQGRRCLRVDGKMVRDVGIAPTTPAWKAGVYLLTPIPQSVGQLRRLPAGRALCASAPTHQNLEAGQ